jgi:RNA polymerase sigma-70 factor (ECF subfamily)
MEAARGCEEGVDWLELSERLRPFIARRVPPAEVDDVLQEALLRIYAGRDGLRDEERLVAWAYRIARRAVADQLRRRRDPLALAAPEEAWEPVVGEEVGEELAAFMGAFVEMLPEGMREAVRLSELEGLDQREVAARLGLSLSGAKSRIQRGRLHLRGLIEACCRVTLDARGRVVGCEPHAQQGCACD